MDTVIVIFSRRQTIIKILINIESLINIKKSNKITYNIINQNAKPNITYREKSIENNNGVDI